MTDPTDHDLGLEPGTPAASVHQALLNAHPTPLAAVEIAIELGHPAHTDGVPAPEALDAVAGALAALEVDGYVTPSTRDTDAEWSLHGTARSIADGQPLDGHRHQAAPDA